ncbi:hypothetical protein [Zavarzinella formosa]|uniref:hypothetical protein n=1 Tax=Zavarzinella formosa TaxID=360055 RepID=UPI00037A70A3|nr:hypothetical protein [Zavarzinella formosa]
MRANVAPPAARRLLRGLAPAVLIVLLTLSCDLANRKASIHADPDRVEACWKQLVDQIRIASLKTGYAEPNSDSGLVRVKKTAAAFRDLADRIGEIPLDGVDPDLVALVGRFIQILRADCLLFEKMTRLLEELETLRPGENQVSPAASNDKDVQDKARRLESKFEDISEKMNASMAISKQFDFDADSLRRSLTAKYGRSFASLAAQVISGRNIYDRAELAALRNTWEDRAGAWGRMLLKETHPTGQFHAASLTRFDVSENRERVVVVIRCGWAAVLSGSNHITLFRAVIDKQKGLLELSVSSDTSPNPISPSGLEAARTKLRDEIRMLSQ